MSEEGTFDYEQTLREVLREMVEESIELGEKTFDEALAPFASQERCEVMLERMPAITASVLAEIVWQLHRIASFLEGLEGNK